MKVFNVKPWRVLSVTFASLLAFSVAGRDLAFGQEAVINNALDIKTFERVDVEDGEEQYTNYFPSSCESVDDVKALCKKAGEDIEAEGMVLLKNDNNALPLAVGSKVSLLGQGAVKGNYNASGSSAAVGVEYPMLGDVMTAEGFDVNQTALDFYINGNGSNYGRKTYNLIGQVNEAPWSEYDEATKSSIETYGDAAIVTFCRDAGEGSDVGLSGSDGEDGSYLSISVGEKELLENLTSMKKAGKISKIVVMLNMAVPMETDFLFRESIDVDACLWIGNVGTYGYKSVAKALKGEITPSGKLVDTFLRDNMSSPSIANWYINKNNKFTQTYSNATTYKLSGSNKYYAVYTEGVYVGYRYYETRYADKVMGTAGVGDFNYHDVVSYPFGYGMSYASFEYSNYSVSERSDSYIVNLDVTNTSDTYDGKEVVEIYIQKPYSDYSIANGIEKPAVELVGFAKTETIPHGQTVPVTVEVKKEELKSYDAESAKTYIIDKGEHYLTAAHDAHDAINNILAAQHYGVSDGMDAVGNAALASVILDQEEVDVTTYALSVETNNPVTNQLDFMDINRYENRGDNHVTYVSRNDWTGTWPSAAISLSVASEEMAADLQSNKEMPVIEGDVMPTYGANNGLSLINLRSTSEVTIPYDDDMWDLLLDQMSFEEQTLLLDSGAYSTAFIESVQKPATKDNDGPTSILGTATGSVFPGKPIWAATWNVDLIKEAGAAFAEDVRITGFHSLYAPGVNIHRTPFGGRANEYYSEDGFLSGMACVSEVKGLQSKGVVPTVKHYAFNNEETNRAGACIWMNEQEAREIMLKPYEFAMRPSMGNAHGIMTSFNRAGCIWTSASSELMINLSRKEYGFDGYSLTDMASSNAANYMLYNDGIYNGTDLFLKSDVETAFSEWSNNPTFCQRVRESCHRVLYVIANFSCIMNGTSSSTKFVPITPWWKNLINGLIVGSSVVGGISIAMLGVSMVIGKKDH